MVRPFSTYLLLIMTCSFFLMGLNDLHLDNFAKTKSCKISMATIGSVDNCAFETQDNALPIPKNLQIEDFDFEHEVEFELDVLPVMEFIPYYFTFNNNPATLFLNVYATYSFTVIKVEFLDIFSPPPNC